MKTVFKAYCIALLGLVLGVIGLHRFYLGFFNTGMWMAGIFFGGVACFAFGYAHLLAPFLKMLSAAGGDLSALPNTGLLNPESRQWFAGGSLLCLASLCWLATDCITMHELTRKANSR